MQKLKIVLENPYMPYPPVTIDVSELPESLELIAFDENLLPRTTLTIYAELPVGYSFSSDNWQKLVSVPVNERFRAFLAYHPEPGPALLNSLMEWQSSSKVEENDETNDEL